MGRDMSTGFKIFLGIMAIGIVISLINLQKGFNERTKDLERKINQKL